MRSLAIRSVFMCLFVAASWRLGFCDSPISERGELVRLQEKYMKLAKEQVVTYSKDQLEVMIRNLEPSKQANKGLAAPSPVVHITALGHEPHNS